MSSHTPIQIKIEKDVLRDLVHYCQRHQFEKFMLVADQNTYLALGKRVEQALSGQGMDVKTIILDGREEVVADEAHLMQVFVQADMQDRIYLAAGSGTITDITRFVSHRTKNQFISLPTAPSVDGFVSMGAPLVIGGLKQTVLCQPPVAAFADLNTLTAAPKAMIAAGFGDMLGKYTSLADWRIGRLLWDERFSEPAAQRTWKALQDCVDVVEGIGQADAASIGILTNSLLESGLSMIEFGSTVPASGSEHHLSHYWEMKLLREKRPAILHGAQVGAACVLVAGYYEKVRQLTRQQVSERLETAELKLAQERENIRSVYPNIGDRLIEAHSAFLEQSQQTYDRLKERIVDSWSEVQGIASSVPTPQVLAKLIRKAGGAATPDQLGLCKDEVSEALRHAHYLRNRFTIIKLSHYLGLL